MSTEPVPLTKARRSLGSLYVLQGHSNSVRCAYKNKLVQISQRNGDTACVVLILERLEVELMCGALRILII